jgi:putative ABC transport system substrate-binding protein
MRTGAVELVSLAPDVILATNVPIVLALQQASRTIPIVFAGAIDPVGAGLVASLARPGGNATGFTMFEYGISAKWLELLREISPGVKRVAVLREPTVAGIGQLAAMQTAAPSLGVELQPIDARDVGQFERVIADFAGAPNGGLIVPLSTSAETHRTRIIALADRHRLPAVYPSRVDAALGGLISYGPDTVDRYRRAAGYVDRILRGEKPADLPVQAPVKYELAINLKTAKALGIDVPARAQQRIPARGIGVLMNRGSNDPHGQSQLAAFQKGLQELNVADRYNVQIDIRWGANIVELERKYAAEFVALTPDVILASGTQSVAALQRASSTLPIVFVGVSDPVGAGFVENLAKPGGNATGFMLFEYSLSGKWLEILKQIMPGIRRAAVLRDAANPAGIAQFGAIRASATTLDVDVSPINVHDADEIERAIAGFARTGNGGLVVTPSASERENRDLIIALAARHKLPAVYGLRYNTTAGGLISYGPDLEDQFRRAAGYVDRVLGGEKPAGLPVQAPTKFELVINMKTARALGLTIPPGVLAIADEVIE